MSCKSAYFLSTTGGIIIFVIRITLSDLSRYSNFWIRKIKAQRSKRLVRLEVGGARLEAWSFFNREVYGGPHAPLNCHWCSSQDFRTSCLAF